MPVELTAPSTHAGIGIEHPLATAYPQVPIISVVAWIGANLKSGGRVTHGSLEKLVMGASGRLWALDDAQRQESLC